MFRPLLSIAALGLTMAVPCYAVPEIKPISLDGITAEQLKLESRNVVSAWLPPQGDLTFDALNGAIATVGDDWKESVRMGILGETVVISRTIPNWYDSKAQPLWQSFQPLLEALRTGEVELKGNTVAFKNAFPRDIVLDAYIGDDEDATPEPTARADRSRTRGLLNEEGAKVKLHLGSSVYYYSADGKTYLGRSRYVDGLPSFRASKPWLDANGQPSLSPNWYKAPAAIEPKVELDPADAALPITLPVNLNVWPLGVLAANLKMQGLKVESVDGRIAKARIYIGSRTTWSAGELMQAICDAGGYELRKTATGYDLRPSGAHREVSAPLMHLAKAKMEQRLTLGKIKQVFTRDGNQPELPFEMSRFQFGKPMPLGLLSEAEKTKVLAQLDEETRAKVGQVWFVNSLILELRGQVGTKMSFDVTPFPAELPLSGPPTFTPFNAGELGRLHEARIVP
ncbi:hypothetical protein EON80_10525 [bacterium]|nr:MAG: hypothetical protein EON80_10525 [bacterium]